MILRWSSVVHPCKKKKKSPTDMQQIGKWGIKVQNSRWYINDKWIGIVDDQAHWREVSAMKLVMAITSATSTSLLRKSASVTKLDFRY